MPSNTHLPIFTRLLIFTILGFSFVREGASAELTPTQMYNYIEKQVLDSDRYKKHNESIDFIKCGAENSQSEAYRDKYFSDCSIHAYTECNNDEESDGVWGWAASRIYYINYMSLFAKKFNIPQSVAGQNLNKLKKIVMKSITQKLQRPIQLEVIPDSSQMGYLEDLDAFGGDSKAVEFSLIHDWTKYRSKQSESRKKIIPTMDRVAAGCAGEIPIMVILNPEGNLYLLSDFDWQFCESRGVNAWVSTECRGWKLVTSNVNSLSGMYRFIATWKDGRSLRAVIDADDTRDLHCPTLIISPDASGSPLKAAEAQRCL